MLCSEVNFESFCSMPHKLQCWQSLSFPGLHSAFLKHGIMELSPQV